MTRVVILGEIYHADLSIGGGPIYPGARPPGYWGGVAPPYPDQGLPGVPPGYWGGVAPPAATHPIAPGGQPPGYWGGAAPPYPDQGLPGGQGGVPTQPIELPEPLPPPPPEIAHQIVVAVWNPAKETWSVRVGEPAPAPRT
jgi:hypothetical protein